ncbi:MAG TPA: DUF481 domain-containing protein [Candidatus Krumholzibacteria bacterium]|nr:DUF481 domain-containing protein [Candidatus Krumholzibacteria bacterium]HRX51053.1 DUF481 domain-containing protein [Candidatus Krumholzibacteria bacterium]
MTKVVLTLLAALMLAGAAFAAESEKSADLALVVNQSGYSDSWEGSELGTLNWTLTADIATKKPLSMSTLWQNQIKLAYGKTRNEQVQENGSKDWGDSEKATDRVFWESMVLFSEGNYVNPYVAVTWESQFHDAEDNIFNPSLLVESAGLGRTLLKNEQTEVFSRLGLAYRQRFMKGADTATDAGLDWVTDVSHTFNEQLKAVSKLRVFQALTSSADDDIPAADPAKDYWKTTDIAWETTLSASVSKYIQTTLFWEVLYDKEISTDARWRDVFGVGFSYKLF